jgi:hypothetical protein
VPVQHLVSESIASRVERNGGHVDKPPQRDISSSG